MRTCFGWVEYTKKGIVCQENLTTRYGSVLLIRSSASALLKISASTIDRLLNPVRIQYQKRGRCSTNPGTLLRNQISIQTNQWNQSRPGFIEADTVAHCGISLSGVFVYTIDTVDIATGWTEQRAIWRKGETDVLKTIPAG